MITRGKLQYSNGLYTGLIENGSPTLAGRFDFSDGRTYIGEFKNNEMSGYGLMMEVNGSFAMGYFSNSLKNGRFIVVNKTSINAFPSSFFVGDYKNDYKNGQGYEITKHEVISSNYSNDVGYGNATSFSPYYGYKYRTYSNGVLNFGEKASVYNFYWDYNFQVEVHGSPTTKVRDAKAVRVNLYDNYVGKFTSVDGQMGLDEFTCEGYKLNIKDDLRPIFTTGIFKHKVDRTFASGSNAYRIDKDYVYFGGFNAKPNGTGVRASIDGSNIQIGRFIDDKLYGRGLYISMGGSIQIGEFSAGSLHGNGVKYCTWTKTVYDGHFNNGTFERGYQKEVSDAVINSNSMSNSTYSSSDRSLNTNYSSSYSNGYSNNAATNNVNISSNNTNITTNEAKEQPKEGYFTRLFKTMGKLPDPIEDKPVSKSKIKEKSPLEIKLSKDFIVVNGKELKKYIGDTSIKEITILEGVTKIRKNCFENLTNLTKVNLPSTLKEIGEAAFKNTNIEVIDFTNTKITTLSDELFKDCKNLKEVILKKDIIAIGVGTFANCTSLTKINLSSLTMSSIPNYAFSNCSSLKEVIIPSCVNGIGAFAFEYCKNLSDFDFTNIKEINGRAFQSTSFKELCFNKVIYIFKHAFECCEQLKKVTINEIDDNKLEEGAFFYCTSLKEVNLPCNITIIKKDLFKNCSDLESFNFENITIIEEKAFAYSGLKEVKANKVREIKEYAFTSCNNLKEIEINNI